MVCIDFPRLFDVQGHAGANPTFQFGSQQFKKVIIQLSEEPDHRLIIETKNNGVENFYIQNLKFNNETIENCWLVREKLMQGVTLTFEMDSVPNKNRGVRISPHSMSN